MAGPTRIVAFGTPEEEPSADDALPAEEKTVLDLGAGLEDGSVEGLAWTEPDLDDYGPSTARAEWLAPGIAALAVSIWTGFFMRERGSELAAAFQAGNVTSLISDWAVPVLLVGVIWLLFMRNSRREAKRFGDVSQSLSLESGRLEERLVTVNRELSLAREFIAAQSRDLEALGRMASDRLSQEADRLQGLIQDNSSQLDSIGSVSEAALVNMEKLRGQLPVISNSAKDVTNNIANAGRTAHVQIEDMVKGFNRINEFGTAAELQVNSLREIVDQTIAEFTSHSEQLEEIAGARFAELNKRGTEFRIELDRQEESVLAAIRERAATLMEELETSRQQLTSQEGELLESLRARLATLRDEGGAIAHSLRESEDQAIETWRSGLSRIEDDRDRLSNAIESAKGAAMEAAQGRLAAIRQEIEQIESEVAERGTGLRHELDARRDEAAAAERAVVAQLDEMFSQLDARMAERRLGLSDELEARRRSADESEQAAITHFGEIFAQLDAQVAKRTAAHEAYVTGLLAQAETVAGHLVPFEERLSEISVRAREAEERIAASLQALAETLAEAQGALSGTDSEVGRLTEASGKLLELIQAGADQSRDVLPAALMQSEERLTTLHARVSEMQAALDHAGDRGEALAARIESSGGGLDTILVDLDRLEAVLQERGSTYQETLGALRELLESLEQQNDRLSEKARNELTVAIEMLNHSLTEAVTAIEERASGGISELAQKMGEESAEAIERAMRDRAVKIAGELEKSAVQASDTSRQATIQLRDQLAKVNELVGNLEQRVTYARERAEEQVDNDFSRRVALITESLNSNSVDIAKALSTDVSDTAWAAYLRGDRGIFTRRAVSLIEASEIKSIQQIFERDSDFREHVSRYIHDFEAILRQVLSTRDGNALGVTLLSSDMGKLYVALAQAIERLRN